MAVCTVVLLVGWRMAAARSRRAENSAWVQEAHRRNLHLTNYLNGFGLRSGFLGEAIVIVGLRRDEDVEQLLTMPQCGMRMKVIAMPGYRLSSENRERLDGRYGKGTVPHGPMNPGGW
jgi:hypothetical protein